MTGLHAGHWITGLIAAAALHALVIAAWQSQASTPHATASVDQQTGMVIDLRNLPTHGGTTEAVESEQHDDPEPTTTAAARPEPEPEPVRAQSVFPELEPEPEAETEPELEPETEATPEPEPEPEPEPAPEPAPEAATDHQSTREADTAIDAETTSPVASAPTHPDAPSKTPPTQESDLDATEHFNPAGDAVLSRDAHENAETDTEADAADAAHAGTRASSVDSGYLGWLRNELERHRRYPPQAQRRRLEGTVIVIFSISSDGLIHDLRIDQSSGHALLDRAALRLLQRHTDTPLSRRPEQAIDDLVLPVVFELP